MITFKEFLNEAPTKDKPQFDSVEVADAIDALNAHCKDALWMLKGNRPLWRGQISTSEINKTGFALVDPSKTERRSENTSNYYTLILDNIPSRKEFPKRSRSFIASTSYIIGRSYSLQRSPIVLIPYDGVKIGVVHAEDIWLTEINLFGVRDEIETFNDRWARFGPMLSSAKWDKWIKFNEMLEDKDAREEALAKIERVFNPKGKVPGPTGLIKRGKEDFLGAVDKAYSPEETGHTVETTATLKKNFPENSEVWVGGPCMAISGDMWIKLRTAIMGNNIP
jgi:hypothetical protein